MMNENDKVALVLDADKVDVDTIKRNYAAYINCTKKYFDELSLWWWVILVISLILSIATLVNGAIPAFLICLAVFGFTIWRVASYKQSQISDEVFDKIVAVIKKKVASEAMDKLCISPSDFIREQMGLDTVRYFDRAGASLSFKTGKDEKVRYSLRNIHLFFFTQKYLAMYECALDLKTGHVLNENTEEFFYKDVVSVGVKTSSATEVSEKSWFESLVTGEALIYSQGDVWKTFELRNSGSGIIQVPLCRQGDKVVDDADNVVNSIRVLLRDLK